MGSHVHNRPDLDQAIGRLPLIISGSLPNTAPFVAYEGRLQMRNFIGPSRAELLEGELPAGYTISVDEGTQEIVVAWPAWEPVAQPVFNGDFERGDVGWQKGAGWQVNYQPADVRITGNWAGVFRGTGQASILCEPQPCLPGTGFAFSALFDQGPSNKKNVDCYAAAVFYDASGKQIGEPTLGGKVHDQNNNSRHASSGNATAPPGTAKASTGALVVRRKYQRPVSVDDIQWGLEGGGVGSFEDAVYPITIRGFDSTGRSEIWNGSVTVTTAVENYFTSVMSDMPIHYLRLDTVADVGAPETYFLNHGTRGVNVPGEGGVVSMPTAAVQDIGGKPPIYAGGGTSMRWDTYGEFLGFGNLDGDVSGTSASAEILVKYNPNPGRRRFSFPCYFLLGDLRYLWWLRDGSGDTYTYQFYSERPGSPAINATVTLVPGQTYHFAVTCQPEGSAWRIRTYLDGVQQATGLMDLNLLDKYGGGTNPLARLGGLDAGGGSIDSFGVSEWAMYDTALSADRFIERCQRAGILP